MGEIITIFYNTIIIIKYNFFGEIVQLDKNG